jgi:hypothetical protein
MMEELMPCHQVVAPKNAWATNFKGIHYNDKAKAISMPATINKALVDSGSTLTKLPLPLYDNVMA